jgi:hypothetical protein
MTPESGMDSNDAAERRRWQPHNPSAGKRREMGVAERRKWMKRGRNRRGRKTVKAHM